MKLFRYNIILNPEPEGGFTVTVPALPGCITYGKNLSEAKKMAREAIQLYLEDMLDHNEPLPKTNNTYFGEVEVAVSRRKYNTPVHA